MLRGSIERHDTAIADLGWLRLRYCEVELPVKSFRCAVALTLVVLVHGGLIALLLTDPNSAAKAGHETIARLVPVQAVVPVPYPINLPVILQKPGAPIIFPPTISIGYIQQENRAEGGSVFGKLPPRLDPDSANSAPDIPENLLAQLGARRSIIVILKVLVLESGKAEDVTVSSSSGFPELDDIAARQVRTNWRFLSATENGKAVRDWITVEVLF